MSKINSGNKVASAGIFTAIISSLCCITPLLAIISGTSGLASTFSWIEPYRPFLVGLTILVLAFAWYQKLRPRTAEEIACACEDDQASFWQNPVCRLVRAQASPQIASIRSVLMALQEC